MNTNKLIPLFCLLCILVACTQQKSTKQASTSDASMSKQNWETITPNVEDVIKPDFFTLYGQFGSSGVTVKLDRYYPADHEYVDGYDIGKPGQRFYDNKQVFGGSHQYDYDNNKVEIIKVIGMSVHYYVYEPDKQTYEPVKYDLPPEMYDDLYSPSYQENIRECFINDEGTNFYVWFNGPEHEKYIAVFYFDLEKRTVKRNIYLGQGVILDTRTAKF